MSLFKKAIIFFSIIILLSGIGLSTTIWYLVRDIPSIDSLREYQPIVGTRVYSYDNRLIGEFYVEKRILVPLKRIPRELFQSILAVEDARFYDHRGIDLLGIIRAFLTNIESFRIRQGASTITQQLTRLLFLSPEKSYKRKIREAALAMKIEKLLTKDEILELYLNQIYFGHGAYGVQAASKTYFGKDVEDITLSEGAFLAGLLKAPNDYSPYYHPERAKRRQGIVLKRMLKEGFITKEQFQKAYKQNLYFNRLKKKEAIAPYFLEYIRQYLASRYGDDRLYKGGLKVYTTLNIEMQKTANKAVQNGLRDIDKRQGFRGPIDHKDVEDILKGSEKITPYNISDLKEEDIVDGIVLDVDSKRAVVMAGEIKGKIFKKDMLWAAKRLKGPDLKDAEIIKNAKPSDILKAGDIVKVGIKSIDKNKKEALFTLEQEPLIEGALISLDPYTGFIKAMVGGYDYGRSEFNRAVFARRQPGSAFKPLVYASAIEKGFTPATTIIDSPLIYTDTVTEKVWKPENYEEKFYGPIMLREALIHSRNVATVKLLEKLGINNVIAFAKKIGIKSPLAKDLSLGLGSSSLGVLELTSAYGVFANQGVRVEPVAILSVKDLSGNVLESHQPEIKAVVSKETSYIITNILEDVIQRGTGRKARVLKRALAGKTGTTNNFTDAWFVGFAPNIATGVWVGFDDRRSLGDRESGARAALPIWIAFMKKALETYPSKSFEIPENIVFTKIDPSTGLLASKWTDNPVIEIFAKGTEPTEYYKPRARATNFFRIDLE
ncbi:MAG: penicillin-binding protein 1A [Nitrospirota bacterium]